MLNLLLPDTGEVQEPVNENVLGAEVRGQSRVANRLQIRLIPDTSRIQMRLEAIGKVFSQTEAQRSGFTIQNVGDARFQVFKRLAIGRDGITADQPEAWSRSTNKMVGMQSELDGVPVLGWVARRVAEVLRGRGRLATRARRRTRLCGGARARSHRRRSEPR
jgi:hypothetical protein